MPDSKVTAVAIICFAIISGLFIYTKKDYLFAKKIAPTPRVDVLASSPRPNLPDTDWQKLINTSIATGTIDQIVSQNTQPTDTSENNLTSQVAKSFFALYLQDQKNGVTIDQNESMNIANQVINNLHSNTTIKQYSKNDVFISTDSSSEAITLYENNLALVVKNDFAKGAVDPIDVMNSYTKTNDETTLKKLDPMIKNYQKMISDTLKIHVPQKAVGYHVIYLDLLSSLLFDIQSMRRLATDPVLGYIGFTGYQKDISAFVILLNSMGNKLSSQ